MELRRFYIEQSAVSGGYVTISKEEYNHIVKVLRFKRGYFFLACDGTGKEYRCRITEITQDSVVAEITDIYEGEAEARINITLYLGAIKGEKLGIAVQKAVELGVSKIVIFSSQNTSEKTVGFARLRTIAKEAAKQCGRAKIPEIPDSIESFENLISKKSETLIMAYEKENVLSLSVLSKTLDGEDSLGVIIGSEGGFTAAEGAAALEKGVKTFSLGRRVLRAETAAIVTLGYLFQEFDSIL